MWQGEMLDEDFGAFISVVWDFGLDMALNEV